MPATLSAILVTALTLIPGALLARRMLGERAAAIFVALYVLTPNLVLFGATSMDGVFAFFLMITAYCFFALVPGADQKELDAEAIVRRGIVVGALLTLSTFFTYASITLVVLFVIWSILQFFTDSKRAKTAFQILAVAGITLALLFAVTYFAWGFNILACAKASIAFDAQRMQPQRAAYWDVSVTNLLGFLVGSGFIASTLWMRCVLKPSRRSECHALCAALGLTVVILSFSTLFTRELERVWM